MVSLAKSVLRDPALAAMGLVPDRVAGGPGGADSDDRALRWRTTWAALALGIVAIVAIFWQSFASMAQIWYDSPTFNHGFLIPVISAYLIWAAREKLATCDPKPTGWGVALIAVLGLGWLAASVASVLVVEQFAVIGMILALFLSLLGWRTALTILFPLCYLLMAVPFGEFLIPPLQDLTALFVVKVFRLFQIPIFLDGVMLTIPNSRFEVAEACSGVRFLIATVALGTLFAYLTYRGTARRTIFVVVSFLVPIVANWFRALGIVLIAYLSSNKYAVGVDHIVYGWIFFSFVTIILLVIGMAFREKSTAPEAAAPAPAGVAVAPGGTRGRIATVAVLCLAVAAVAPGYKHLRLPAGDTRQAINLALPRIGGGWRLDRGARSDWQPRFPTADASLLRSYVKDGRRVQLFIAYYAMQAQEREVVNNLNRIADGKSWNRAADWETTVTLAGQPLSAMATRMVQGERYRLAYSWNWVDDRFTASPHISKLLQVRSLLTGGRRAAAAIIVSTNYNETPDQAQSVMQDFLENIPWLRPALENADRG